MQYKENWEDAKKRLEAYWHRENEGRCLLGITAVRKKKIQSQLWTAVPQGVTCEEHWLDAEKIIERNNLYFENTYFAAEAVPFVNVNLGAGITAAYLGCTAHLHDATVWFENIISDWNTDQFEFKLIISGGPKTKEITKKVSEAGASF